MKQEAKMLPIRRKDSLTIPLHHLSQGEMKTFPRGPNEGCKLTEKIPEAENTSVLGTILPVFHVVTQLLLPQACELCTIIFPILQYQD